MKTITITLKDDDLCAAIESEAKIIGVSEEDMIIHALEFWLAETEMDCEEQRELDAARRECEEVGGVEAREFFDGLRAEDARRGPSMRYYKTQSEILVVTLLKVVRRGETTYRQRFAV